MAELTGWITFPDESSAERIATSLLEQQLIACAQLEGPVLSMYRWKGQLEKSTEWRLTVKTTEDHTQAIEAFLLAEHPYEIPQVIWIAWHDALVSYRNWVRESIQ